MGQVWAMPHAPRRKTVEVLRNGLDGPLGPRTPDLPVPDVCAWATRLGTSKSRLVSAASSHEEFDTRGGCSLVVPCALAASGDTEPRP